MATPKELVDARLKELRMSKAKLMKAVGYQTGFQDYYNVFVAKPHQLTDEVKEKIAAVLGRQADWLKDGGEFSALKRERYIREQFELFLQSDVGKAADPETIRILQSMLVSPCGGNKLETWRATPICLLCESQIMAWYA